MQVPLETLSSQLQQYLTVLKGKLVEVINEDYNDFVSLSTKLVNVDGAVTQMQKPLLTLKVRACTALPRNPSCNDNFAWLTYKPCSKAVVCDPELDDCRTSSFLLRQQYSLS